MKITKTQLRKIIKEEMLKEEMLKEAAPMKNDEVASATSAFTGAQAEVIGDILKRLQILDRSARDSAFDSIINNLKNQHSS